MKRGAVLAVIFAGGLGCSLVKNADDVVVGSGATDSEVVDSAARPDTATAIDGSADVAVDAPVTDSGVDAKIDSLVVDTSDAADTAVLVEDRRWALWPMPSPTPSSYDTSKTDVVIDNITKLRWQKAVAPAGKTWDQAIKACEALTLDGTTGWRLPTRVELVSLLAFSPGNFPTLNSGKFPGTPSTRHWTKSDTAKGVYFVDFGTGLVGFALETEVLDFRCVHSP